MRQKAEGRKQGTTDKTRALSLPVCMWVCRCAMVLTLLTVSAFDAPAGRWWDDFDDGNLHGWDVYNFEPRVEKWDVQDGAAVGEIFELGSMSLLVAGEPDWVDYTVSCRAKFEKTMDEQGSLGISIYESEDADNRYAFFLNISAGTMAIWRVEKGDWGVPVTTLFEVEKDTWYTLQASVIGPQLAFVVNDTPLVAISRELLPPGRFALVVSNARVYFDDVSVEGENIPDRGPTGFAVEGAGKLSVRWADLKQP